MSRDQDTQRDIQTEVSVSWVDVMACALLAVLLLVLTSLAAQGDGKGNAFVLVVIDVFYERATTPADYCEVGGQKLTATHSYHSWATASGTRVSASRQLLDDGTQRRCRWQVGVIVKSGDVNLATVWTRPNGAAPPTSVRVEVVFDSRRKRGYPVGQFRPIAGSTHESLGVHMGERALVNPLAGLTLEPVPQKEPAP